MYNYVYMASYKNDIIKVLKAYINKDYNFTISSDFKGLLEYSSKLCVSPIIGYTLHKNSLYRDIHDFDEAMYICASRYEKQRHYRELIGKILSDNSIEYLYLKGHTLSKYYDEESLRYSTDIDILVNKDDYDLVRHILVDEHSYKLIIYKANEFNVSKNSIVFDIQNKLTEDDEKVDSIYSDIEFNSSHELNNEYKYLFIITHAAKHLRTNYINIQFLLDLYYVNKLNLNRELINNKLKECNLDKFNEVCLKTIDVLFNGANSDDIVDGFINYLFNEGLENRVLAYEGNNYIISRLFPNTKTMCLLYPSLTKHKALLPMYYVRRIIDRISMGKLNNAIKEAKLSNSINNDEVVKTNELFKKIGLR